MKTLRALFYRRLAALALCLLVAGCGAPAQPAPTAPGVPTGAEAAPSEAPPTATAAIPPTATASVATKTPAPTATTRAGRAIPSPSPRPGLTLEAQNFPEDVKQVVQEYPPFVLNPLTGKLLLPEDSRCSDLPLQDFDVLLFQSLRWKAGQPVKVSFAAPEGRSLFANLTANEQGNAQVVFQPGTQAMGQYLVMQESGAETRRCSFVYRPKEKPGLYFQSGDPLKPIFDRKEPAAGLQLSGFASYEVVRLLVYAAAEKPGEWTLLGWRKVKVDSNGQLALALNPEESNRTYAAIGEKSGEVHLSLPSPYTGIQTELMKTVKFMNPVQP